MTDSQPSTNPAERPPVPVRLAYLVSSYPILSVAWLLREVLLLREMGFTVETAAVNVPDRSFEVMAEAERREAATTYYLKRHGIGGGLKAHAAAIARAPAGYARGLLKIPKLAGGNARSLLYQVMYFTEGLMIGKWMRSKGLRHLHVHLASQGATVGLYTKVVFGCGLSLTVHGPDEFYDVTGQHLAEKVRAADLICCISHYAQSQLMRLSDPKHWPKLVVSRLGVDPQVFLPASRAGSHDAVEILCVGRLVPAKGQHLLLEATAQILRQGRNVRLRLVGDGPDAASLRQHASKLGLNEAVVFEGGVNQDRIRELYAQADIFCIPSFAEGIPVVLMEAMAMEIPCVSTHITGIPELIRTEVDGLLVAPADRDGLYMALLRLVDDPQLRKELGRNGRQRVAAEYDLFQNVQVLADILSSHLRPADHTV